MSATVAVPAHIIPVEPSKLSELSIDPKSLQWKDDAKANTTRIVYESGKTNAFVSLGKDFATKKRAAKEEAYRQAVATGLKKVKAAADAEKFVLHVGEYPQASATAATLGQFSFTLKTKKGESPVAAIEPSTQLQGKALEGWNRGLVYAQSQNLVRELMELPANLLTPTSFCEKIKKEFANVPDTEVIIRDEEWASEKGMRTFLSVTKGTDEPAKFLEIHYNGGAKGDPPLAFIGKGITFDSGGISIKPSANMKLMRGDMGGAATVTAAALAIAKLKLPINLVVCTPLCENLPGPSANKPGDVIYAMNGKSVEVDNTDAEGRLVLSDAIYYAASTFKPHTLIDVATLTGAMDIALGSVFTGVFTNSDALWNELYEAGETEYDRVWRMPLDEEYGPQIYSSNADLCNTGGRPGGSCTAALFLKAFVPDVESEDKIRWAHLDIAGTMDAPREGAYQKKGMTGRGTRTLIEFVRNGTSAL